MYLNLRPSWLRLLLAMLSLAFCSSAQAGGAFLVKLGDMQLTDDSQSFDGMTRDFDRSSYHTAGVMLEKRLASGVGLGAEYLTYRNSYTPDGTADTRAVMFVAHKYFIHEGNLHPFIGLGAGFGRTSVEHTVPASYKDEEFTTVIQVALGVEYRVDNFSFMLEGKHLYHDINSGGNEYNPTATGLFAGFGFIW